MRDDPIKSRLREMAVEIREDLVQQIAGNNPSECELCGRKRFQKGMLEYETRFEVYSGECPRQSCSGTVNFGYLYVKVGDEIPIVNDEFTAVRCTGSCENIERVLPDFVEEHDPNKVDEYVLPLQGILTTQIDEHHISYEPEETMLVCSSCHNQIHHDDSFRPDLRPDMSRSEWEENNE